MKRLWLPALVTGALVASAGALPQRAVELRDLGIALLENEQPAEAADVFRGLIEQAPDDPLGYANLAIAALRQQQIDEALRWIDGALDRSPARPDLLAIKAEVLQWSGRVEEALDVLRSAAAAAPEDLEILYGLHRLGTSLGDEAAVDEALGRLARLRPENLVVLLGRGGRSIQRADRATATAAFLRVRELLWGAPPVAEPLLAQVLDALAAGETEAARVPAIRLENVLKVTPMYQQSLRELTAGIQGVPVVRFAQEPPTSRFGSPVPVRFRADRWSAEPLVGAALAVADLDGDQKSDVAWIAAGEPPTLKLRLSRNTAPGPSRPAAGVEGLLAADLDNDGRIDLIGYGSDRLTVWRANEGGVLEEATGELGLGSAGATAAAILDFDIEGDLDLFLAGGRSGGGALYRNPLAGPLEAVGDRSLPDLGERRVHQVLASDLDRDGDLDLLVAHAGGLTWLDNLRQGEFADRTREGGLAEVPAASSVLGADLDNDGWPDLVTAGEGLTFLHNRSGRFAPWGIGKGLETGARFVVLEALDADNDGRLDLAVAGERGLAVLAQRDGPAFEFLPLDDPPSGARALVAADLDEDGDLDLVAGSEGGLHFLENLGGNRNRWLSVRLRGLDKGNSKNNLFGLGAVLEVRAGLAYQFREVDRDVAHFGLGQLSEADLLRVVWTNGVPQNRLDVGADQLIVEEQVLKGSCPFLYAWDGERIAFVTDLLWGAPLGLPVAPGVWADADPSELVRVPRVRPRGGRYDLRITEELWEAAFFDHVRLWVVDHPADVEVESSLRIVPGRRLGDRILATRELRPVEAWDANGREVSRSVRERDEIYADGWTPSRYQGVTESPWSLTFDLGEAPGAPIRLHLTGWVFPSDASLNLALAQRREPRNLAPRLEVETESGWRTLMPELGFPAGKTKTMVIDTPPLPSGSRRLRIVSSMWLSWDRIAWSLQTADHEPEVRARLLAAAADLHYRGFSAPLRLSPNGPHLFDYERVETASPWLPFPGRYTRYGDVRELLEVADDRSVILAPGDELSLSFDASALAPPPPGWRRSLFLESHGWDKDADRNTWEAEQLEPLPFRAMSGYPYGPGESYPDSPLHREYRERWLTRRLPPGPAAAAGLLQGKE